MGSKWGKGERRGSYKWGDKKKAKKKDDWPKDPRTPEEIRAQERAQQALQSAESGGEMHRASKKYPRKTKAKGALERAKQ